MPHLSCSLNVNYSRENGKIARHVYPRAASTTRVGESDNRTIARSVRFQIIQARLCQPELFHGKRRRRPRAFCKLVVNRVYGDYLCSVYNRLSLFAVQFAFSQLYLFIFFFLPLNTAAITTIKGKILHVRGNESSRPSISACV